jgi:hypothetical protein
MYENFAAAELVVHKIRAQKYFLKEAEITKVRQEKEDEMAKRSIIRKTFHFQKFLFRECFIIGCS